jgi:hypothetical protein
MSKPDPDVCPQSGFVSPSSRKLKANAKRFCGRKWSLRKPQAANRVRYDCVPSGQSCRQWAPTTDECNRDLSTVMQSRADSLPEAQNSEFKP